MNLILPFLPPTSLMSVFSCVSLSHRLEFLPSGAYLWPVPLTTPLPAIQPLATILLADTMLLRHFHCPHTSLYNFCFGGYRLSFGFLNPKDGTDRLPETSVRNYQHALRKNPEDCSSQLSRKIVVVNLWLVWVFFFFLICWLFQDCRVM